MTPGELVAPSSGDAVYELVMGDLEKVPLARLADLINMWTRQLDGLVKTEATIPVAASDLAEIRLCRTRVELNASAGAPELVASFTGPAELVRQFRRQLREAGIDAGDRV